VLGEAVVQEQIATVVKTLVEQAHVSTFVPLVAENLGRQQIHELVAAQHDADSPG